MKLEHAWYIEWVDHTGTLRWSGFVDGFEAAWNTFSALRQTAGMEEWKRFEDSGQVAVGRVRVREPDGASIEEMGLIDDASGFGAEPFVGYDNALAKLTLGTP